VPQIVYKEVGEIVISGGILRDNMWLYYVM
jgi:hypothetical protein